jgi:hypothetical protein
MNPPFILLLNNPKGHVGEERRKHSSHTIDNLV